MWYWVGRLGSGNPGALPGLPGPGAPTSVAAAGRAGNLCQPERFLVKQSSFLKLLGFESELYFGVLTIDHNHAVKHHYLKKDRKKDDSS